jgi:hypothetical protein
MTKENTINAGLLTLGSALITFAIANLATNGWFALICAVLGVGTFVLYSYLP